jgi:HEPN domain-containing protein
LTLGLAFMARRHQDWIAQAREDLRAAAHSLSGERFEWAAFQAQQAAEKALKALLRFHHREVEGHSVSYLLREVGEPEAVASELVSMAKELDRHYIQTRYPNSFPEGYPAEFYTQETAARCVEFAERILEFVARRIS